MQMRHDAGNALKDQGNRGELTALPRNSMECAVSHDRGLRDYNEYAQVEMRLFYHRDELGVSFHRSHGDLLRVKLFFYQQSKETMPHLRQVRQMMNYSWGRNSAQPTEKIDFMSAEAQVRMNPA
jgi:hypothetical protein